jgi:hypothetical protein
VKRHRETLAFLLLLILGLAPRLAIISRFPTIPVSDFHNLVAFGLHLRDDGLTSSTHPGFWENFNVGLPLVLCGLFKLFPHANPDSVARFASAFVSGLLPLLPFWIWRDVLSFRLRVLAGAALALWPGQVVFSGVVAQDNWAIFPAIALGALAVRALADGDRAWLVTAGLMYTAATAMRADMLVLLPLLLAAVRVDLLRTKPRQVLAGVLAAALGLFGLAAYRHAASGRFSLGTEHGGVTVLGAYVPGTTLPALNGTDGLQSWIPPYAFLAWDRPDLLRDHKAMLAQALGVTVREAFRRPAFHALRIVSMAGFYAIHGESSDLLYGSLVSSEVLPAAIHARGVALAARLKPVLRIEMAAIQALFLAAVIIGIRRRNWPILVLASAVLLKYGIHVLVVLYGRFFVPATGLEILTIAVAVEEVLRMAPSGRRPLLARALAVGAAFSLLLILLPPRLLAYVQKRDIDPGQHLYRFVLELPRQSAELACVVDRGILTSLLSQSNTAAIRTLEYDPAPGDKAVANCLLTGSGKPAPLMLQVLDSYAPGGLGGRMIQRVELDGDEVLSHDIGKEPGTGWANIPLGLVGTGTRKRVVIEVKAIRPVAGEDWGDAALTTFQIVRSPSAMHLAVAMPTAQSSTLSEYGTTSSRAAADANTDGNFFNGSVTSTNRDANAWWQVDLGASTAIGSIVIWNRTDCCSSRLGDYWVFLSETPFSPTDTPATLQKRAGIWKSHQTVVPSPSTIIRTDGAKGRYVRVQLTGTDYLSLAEVQVFGTEK